MSHPDPPWPLLQSVAAVADAPLAQMAERLRDATLPYLASSALVIFSEDCTGWPRKMAGDSAIISRVSIAELVTVRAAVSDEAPWFGEAEIGGRPRPVFAVTYAPSRALLVLTDARLAGPEALADLDLVTYLWRIAARRIQEKVTDAPPSYLLESRTASAERVRVTAELTDLSSATLETLLAALRSPLLDDARARSTVIDLTTKALIGLRTLSDRTTALVNEPVANAFERLREDLRPLTRLSGIEVEFIEPPLNGPALPGEVAQAARAIVHGILVIMMEQSDVNRIRTHWDCDGANLLINIRDDGGGKLSVDTPRVSRVNRRVQALAGLLRIDVMPGWGSDVFVTLPLHPSRSAASDMTGWNLAPRELEVLQHLATGQRNRTIAEALNISENTVKFHVRNLFNKMGVNSRAEVIALALSHAIR